MSLYQNLTTNFPNLNFKKKEPLSQHVHLGLGGPAEVFWQATNPEDFIEVVRFAKKHQLPLTILGWGSNVLIADRGIKGLVVKNKINQFEFIDKPPTELNDVNPITVNDARWEKVTNEKLSSNQKYSDDHSQFSIFNFKFIKVFSGTSLPWLINQLLEKNILGLHHFIKIPGTVGGAVVNNVHGGPHLISKFVLGVEIVDRVGQIKLLKPAELKFGYDFSRFHQTDEVITHVYLRLWLGDKTELENAKSQVQTMLKAKTAHEFKSLGCVWQNLDPKTQTKLNLPTPSTGYLIDKVLKLKNLKVGGAQVSPKHAAFITTTQDATASDYLEIMKQINQKAKEKLNIKLKPEIFFLGFTKEELAGII